MGGPQSRCRRRQKGARCRTLLEWAARVTRLDCYFRELARGCIPTGDRPWGSPAAEPLFPSQAWIPSRTLDVCRPPVSTTLAILRRNIGFAVHHPLRLASYRNQLAGADLSFPMRRAQRNESGCAVEGQKATPPEAIMCVQARARFQNPISRFDLASRDCSAIRGRLHHGALARCQACRTSATRLGDKYPGGISTPR